MSKSEDLHGNAPDKSNVALLLIDVISDFEFEDGEKLFENTLPIAKNILNLKEKAKKAGVPVVYVNDNFGKWQSNFKNLLEHCLDKSVRGSQIVEMLAPDDNEDYFVLKPKNSGFYSTTLDLLLQHLNCKTLVLTGVATDICILFTANDAYLRDFNLIVPSDCVAANEKKDNERTLKYLEKIVKADVRSSDKINFSKLKKGK
jgi:nicotinamidase-related amidase